MSPRDSGDTENVNFLKRGIHKISAITYFALAILKFIQPAGVVASMIVSRHWQIGFRRGHGKLQK